MHAKLNFYRRMVKCTYFVKLYIPTCTVIRADYIFFRFLWMMMCQPADKCCSSVVIAAGRRLTFSVWVGQRLQLFRSKLLVGLIFKFYFLQYFLARFCSRIFVCEAIFLFPVRSFCFLPDLSFCCQIFLHSARSSLQCTHPTWELVVTIVTEQYKKHPIRLNIFIRVHRDWL